MKGGVRSTFHRMNKFVFAKGGVQAKFIVKWVWIGQRFLCKIVKMNPHVLVERLISEADISAGFATSLRLAIVQLLRIVQTKVESMYH